MRRAAKNENLQPEHPCSDIEQGCSIYKGNINNDT